jgi:uncharacterized protein
MKQALAFVFGSIFSIGLMLSSMVNPEKVLSFLDLFGDWDPSLAFVMLGAITIAFLPFQKARRNTEPKTLFNESIQLPTASKIDHRLVLGAVLFGVGWGTAGICPAPALTLLGLGYDQGLYFIAAMFIGMWVCHYFQLDK